MEPLDAVEQSNLWWPYAQMKTMPRPIEVVATRGSSMVLADGRELIDGIASWWTAAHGYNHPHIRDAVKTQLEMMPHVMFSGVVHEQAARLSSRLTSLLPGSLDRVFFSESGSVAVEIAMKMAIQYWANRGEKKRKRFVSFRGGYHGDTFATMAACDPTVMHANFSQSIIDFYSAPIPSDANSINLLESYLEQQASTVAALIIEPLVQGAGGMRFHKATDLQRLRQIADRFDVLLIFDEIFTGFGRTGTLFACEQPGVTPDIVTLSKALTGGTLPLAATVATKRVFEAFWSDDPTCALMHGPTYMANPLGCAAANASLDLFETTPRLKQVEAVSHKLEELAICADVPGVTDVRVLGAIGVVELSEIPDLNAIRQRFVDLGVWIRPFRNIIYLTPAFTISDEELTTLIRAIIQVVSELSPSRATVFST